MGTTEEVADQVIPNVRMGVIFLRLVVVGAADQMEAVEARTLCALVMAAPEGRGEATVEAALRAPLGQVEPEVARVAGKQRREGREPLVRAAHLGRTEPLEVAQTSPPTGPRRLWQVLALTVARVPVVAVAVVVAVTIAPQLFVATVMAVLVVVEEPEGAVVYLAEAGVEEAK